MAMGKERQGRDGRGVDRADSSNRVETGSPEQRP
jgi:hypothetical protein